MGAYPVISEARRLAFAGGAFVSLIKGTDDDHHGGSIGAWFPALVGVGPRHSRRWLKRAAPTDARGRCPQKINFVSLVKRETTVTVPINHSLALAGGAFVSLIKGRTTNTAAIKGRSYA